MIDAEDSTDLVKSNFGLVEGLLGKVAAVGGYQSS